MNLLRVFVVILLSSTWAISASAQTMSRESVDILARNIHCTIGEIAVFPTRMHITCNERAGMYYALALSDRPYVDHVLDIAREAKLNDRWVMLRVDPARPDNPPGCQQSDCFRIQAISLR